ncbi:MAG: mandelate racemase/muconate lactonizing enzyme family protein [Steroidobacteraceae bacterium]
MAKDDNAALAGRRRFLQSLAGSSAAAVALSQSWPAQAQGRRAAEADLDAGKSGFKIKRVTASALFTRGDFDYGGVKKTMGGSACYVEIETENGTIGNGITAIVDTNAVAYIINTAAARALIGMDALRNEEIWNRLYWMLAPRGQTGLAGHVMSSLDIAVWDIKGKALGVPVATLLGGARAKVPVYATFGPANFAIDELVAVATAMKAQGIVNLKMVVGNSAIEARHDAAMDTIIEEDIRRVAAVRKAVGDDVNLMVDGNCGFDLPGAERLVRGLMPYRITFFEEPLAQNDVRLMAQLRKSTGIALAAGQNDTLAYQYRDMILAEAVDYIQPNVMMAGGYTEVAKIAGMAQAFNVDITNGGAGALQNMHLHAGLQNGGYCEWHLPWMTLDKIIYKNMPEPVGGFLTIPDVPGLGIVPDEDAIREASKPRGGRGGRGGK